jgi:murein DD-endopeptidase MepM/ murein hydrolase activator NlpD
MSGSNSNLQILLGAEDFSEYLVLSEMTKSVSAKDAKLINKIIAAIDEIEVEKAEIQKIADEQDAVKAELDAQKKNLNSQVAEVNALLKDINADINQAQKDYDKAGAEIDKLSSPQAGNSNLTTDPTKFLWPVPGYYRISAGWQSNDSVHKGTHKGIDISTGGRSVEIVACDDGYVYIVKNSCTHNYGKNYSCGCGGGYGNYVAIDHGKGSDGKTYKTLYAHMKKAVVKNGQYVKRGQVIGYVGTTGWSTGYHLHLETIVNGTKVNPKKFQYQRE